MSNFDTWLLDVVKGRNLDEDYNTNSPSYYDDLSKRNKLMKMLAAKIWQYDQELAKRFIAWDENLEAFDDEVKKLLQTWMDDGTFDHIINETIFSWKADQIDLDETNAKLNASIYEETVTVRIPSDFPDLQSAIDEYSMKRKKQGKLVRLLIEKDHLLTKGVQVRHGDYSHFEIVSENPITYLSPYFEGVQALAADSSQYAFSDLNGSLIAGINATLPTLGCIIDMNNKNGTGYFLFHSKGLVKRACGVINAGLRGIYAVSSHIDARHTNFSGAMNEGFRAQHGTTGDLMNANFDNCCKDGIGEAAIYVSKGCLVGARELTAQNSGTNGLLVRRSRVDAEQSNFSGSKGRTYDTGSGIRAVGASTVSAINAICNDGFVGVHANQGSTVAGVGEALRNGFLDLEVRNGGVINATGCKTTGTASSGKTPDLVTANIKIANMTTGNGIIFSETEASVIEYTSNPTGSTVKFADGTQIFVSPQVTANVDVAVNEFSPTLTRPVKPAGFTSVLTSHIKVWGKTNLDGGGIRVGVDVYGRFDEGDTLFRIRNTGVETDGVLLDRPIKSVQYKETLIGRWK